jgi:hypothetical protein
MATIAQGESCTIPAGHAEAVVRNTDVTRGGSYDIVIEGNSTKKQIAAGETQRTAIHQNEAEITNSGKPDLDVPDGA